MLHERRLVFGACLSPVMWDSFGPGVERKTPARSCTDFRIIPLNRLAQQCNQAVRNRPLLRE